MARRSRKSKARQSSSPVEGVKALVGEHLADAINLAEQREKERSHQLTALIVSHLMVSGQSFEPMPDGSRRLVLHLDDVQASAIEYQPILTFAVGYPGKPLMIVEARKLNPDAPAQAALALHG